MKELLNLALPVVLTYLGMTVMGFVDLAFVGRVNAAAIGAVGVGTSLFNWFLVFIIGLSSGLEYFISHSHGAKNQKNQNQYLIQGLLLIIGVSIPLTLILLFISSNLQWFGINSEVLEPAKSYSVILALSLPVAGIFNVLRLYLGALGVARPAMYLLVLGNLINAGIDYILVLGHWGMPSLGALGAAWATLIARVIVTLGIAACAYFWDKNEGGTLASGLRLRYHAQAMKDLIRLGVPSALQMVFEAGVFALATTLAARLATDELAAHQIVLNIASATFMVPLGIGSATAVLVGQSLGKKDATLAIQTGWRGFALGVGFMAFSCIGLLCFSDLILSLFTRDIQVIALGKSILIIAALFQLSDGVQTVGTGALRGLGDTHSPMVFNLCGHWLVGLPLGIFLCFHLEWGLRGLWIGLSFGLTLVAIAVFARWWIRAKSPAGFQIKEGRMG